LDVGQEGGERVLAKRRTGQGNGKRCAQRRGRRQGPLARTLGGRGGQVARGAVIAVQRAGGDQRVQARVECFGRGQGSVGVGAAQHRHVADVRRAQLRTQARVQRHAFLRDRSQLRKIVLPERPAC